MENNRLDTQQKIVEAARRVFIRKGMAGARMQEIADEAGINKALLHYYYRSKAKLFEHIFDEARDKLFTPLVTTLNADIPLFEKIQNICLHYSRFLKVYPYLPNFVIGEVYRAPDILTNQIERSNFSFDCFARQVKEEIAAGRIREIDPRDLVINIISMNVFPVLVRPIARQLLFQEADYDQVLEERAYSVAKFIIDSIRLPQGEEDSIG